jgi:hypothetical protein
MAFAYILPLRATQAVLSIIVLGLTAYGAFPVSRRPCRTLRGRASNTDFLQLLMHTRRHGEAGRRTV